MKKITENTEGKKQYPWWIVLITLPFYLTWKLIWKIWTKENLSKRTKVLLISLIAVFFLIVGIVGNNSSVPQSKSKGTNAKKTIINTGKDTEESVKTAPIKNKIINQTIADQRKNFDNKKGNNSEAADTAEGFTTVAKDASGSQGIDMYLELDAPNAAEEKYKNGGDTTEYRKSIASSFLTVAVNASFWGNASAADQRNLISGWIGSLRRLYPGSDPNVIVSNGSRTIATGNWSVWNNDTVIKLK